MKKLYLLLIISFSGVFILNSCNKDDFEPKDWPIPQEVLDYYYFPTGSYWVFENDKTGEKDTLAVTKRRKYWIDGSRGDRYEQGDVFISSSLDGYTYQYYVMTQGSAGCIRDGANHPCYGIYCSKFKSGDYVGESLSFAYPFQKNYSGFASAPTYNSTFVVDSFIDSIVINGDSFFKLLLISVKSSVVNQKKDTKYYWAKGAGIVQKENFTDGEIWNLINYKIVK